MSMIQIRLPVLPGQYKLGVPTTGKVSPDIQASGMRFSYYSTGLPIAICRSQKRVLNL